MLTVRRTRYRYGGLKWQTGDLWLPDRTGTDPLAVVVLIHGGYWRPVFTKALMNRLARAVVARGWAAWNIEYRRTGTLGGGGGWPATFVDVGAAVDFIEKLPRVDPERVITCGHSSGGQLALWVAARERTAMGTPGAPTSVFPRAAISLAGVVDLDRGAQLGLGSGAIPHFLGGSPEEHPERYRSASPMALLPLGVPQVLVHGLADTVVPASMSEDYQRAAHEAGDDAVFVPIAGLGHRQMLDPHQEEWPVVASHVERLMST